MGQNRLYLIDIRHLDTALSRLQREQRSQGTSSHIDFFPEAENRVFAMLTTKPIPFVSGQFNVNSLSPVAGV